MANNSATKRKDRYVDFDKDFLPHPNGKDIIRVVDENAIKQSVETLLGHDYYEAPMQPLKGSPVHRLLFEPMGQDVVIELKEAILEVLEKYEPRIEVTEIRVEPDYDAATYEIKIIFRILNTIDLSLIEFILERVN